MSELTVKEMVGIRDRLREAHVEYRKCSVCGKRDDIELYVTNSKKLEYFCEQCELLTRTLIHEHEQDNLKDKP